MSHGYEFDRYLRYDELVAWLHAVAADAPELVTLDIYGRSHEGRDLWLVTLTDTATGDAADKPAHWVDASIHAVELTATVAACSLIEQLVAGHRSGDERIRRALATRAFYVVPRVNPDGAEWVLADEPRFRRSSTRPWPWGADTTPWPGHTIVDLDGDGRILQMRIADPHGAWMPHPDDSRLLVAVPPEGAPADTPTYRLFDEGQVHDFDGFTIDAPPPVESLDLNRNFPAGWSAEVTGSGDHPMSEPEIDALVRAIGQRPNVCGYHAFHTSGGVLLRPSSTQPDSELEPRDVWVWTELGRYGTERTGYPVHSVFDDFTLDRRDPMSGAADDWVYEHLGVYGWTTEFWDIVHRATGTKQSTHFWYTGPTDAEALAVLLWCDEHHTDGFVDWYEFEHPTLGSVELGGWDSLSTWINPPAHLLRDEVAPHADLAIHQALCSPLVEVVHDRAERLGDDTWRVEIGVANTGFLPTAVTQHAAKKLRVLPVVAEIDGGIVLDGPARRQLGQLAGRSELRWANGNDGTPDRVLVTWTVRAAPGTDLRVAVRHPRAGRVVTEVRLPSEG